MACKMPHTINWPITSNTPPHSHWRARTLFGCITASFIFMDGVFPHHGVKCCDISIVQTWGNISSSTLILCLSHFNNVPLMCTFCNWCFLPFYPYLATFLSFIFFCLFSFPLFIPLFLIHLFPPPPSCMPSISSTHESLLLTSSFLWFFSYLSLLHSSLSTPPHLLFHYPLIPIPLLSLLQCDCSASARRFVLRRLWVLGWRGGVEEVSFQSHSA